jgi:hypothetical protein
LAIVAPLVAVCRRAVEQIGIGCTEHLAARLERVNSPCRYARPIFRDWIGLLSSFEAFQIENMFSAAALWSETVPISCIVATVAAEMTAKCQFKCSHHL